MVHDHLPRMPNSNKLNLKYKSEITGAKLTSITGANKLAYPSIVD